MIRRNETDRPIDFRPLKNRKIPSLGSKRLTESVVDEIGTQMTAVFPEAQELTDRISLRRYSHDGRFRFFAPIHGVPIA